MALMMYMIYRSHVFERASQEAALEDYVEEIAVVRTLPDDSEYHAFFWNHAEDIAKRYDIALHDIVLCRLDLFWALRDCQLTYILSQSKRFSTTPELCLTMVESTTSHILDRMVRRLCRNAKKVGLLVLAFLVLLWLNLFQTLHRRYTSISAPCYHREKPPARGDTGRLNPTLCLVHGRCSVFRP